MHRTRKNMLTEWWWTIDRPMLVALILLLFFGLVLSMAASPAIAMKLNLDAFHFVKRHAMFVPVALCIMIGVTFLSPRGARRLALFVLVCAFAGMVLTLLVGGSGEGGTALDFHCGILGAAIRIHEARIRGHCGVALCRE